MNKRKIEWGLIFGLILSLSLFSCSDSNQGRIDDLEKELEKLKEQIEKDKQEAEDSQPFIKLGAGQSEIALDFYPGETREVKIESKGIKEIKGISTNSAWRVTYDEASQIAKISAPILLTLGDGDIMISGINDKGQVFRGSVSCTLNDYSNPNGTFILNEGNAWGTPAEMGSLIYISPREVATPNVYYTINKKRLGAFTQDMVESNGRYFVISQKENAETDGQLTIFDVKTLKKVGNYSSELSELNSPTHIAVVGNKIYIRDNKGIWLFDTTFGSNKLTLIEGTNGARQNVMAVSHDKVFFSHRKALKVIDSDKDKIVYENNFGGNISGVIKADDDHIYISNFENKMGVIRKINTKTYEVEQENTISEEDGGKLLQASFASAPSISAKGDTIYYSSLGQKIYRHIFSTNTSKMMVDVKESLNQDHTVTYNTAQVHPVTGLVYFNTLKGFGPDYKINTIYRFDMTGDQGKLLHRWDNISRFPVGIFFPPAN